MLGAVSSALTLFRQIGGSIGLALAGAIFGSTLNSETPRQLTASGVPQPIVDRFTGSGTSIDGELTGVGVNLSERILASAAAESRAAIEPYLVQIVDGIHQAFSISIANALWLGLAAAGAAAVIVAALVPELALRHGPEAEIDRASRPAVPIMK